MHTFDKSSHNKLPENISTLHDIRVMDVNDLIEANFSTEQVEAAGYLDFKDFLNGWLKENEGLYYASESRRFSIYNAVTKAQDQKKKVVVVENMS